MGLIIELEGVNFIDVMCLLILDLFEVYEVDEYVQDLLVGDGKGMWMEVDVGGVMVLLWILLLVVVGCNVGVVILICDVIEVKWCD